ncbi:MAG: tRNA (adenosine(37)-N6)-threonylcarbamoyltransferase complex ATPase subunit type 1 TsaE [Candidatus Marinimicrobia bacterium]|jgi:tRNA threonylcarbamoyladenosine biosynthesis protein TsaE|nr:tRNA (adenosine(37)-N6)-threonylcarbamoyltransferase complex ATPase subunit type 1 TsaE [Candidatus Neomarinimicrobiota bacterium]MDP6853410.1 tRNA (adenosine(37)-N6)-threonylcarbamoyltransferase complex ATPase subunit type 1 TsaE [Candidatus Neomarinimicrobiota bacterium]MDP6936834.1 tRNA (adenosine(37)-N6)-threonylcarbamoyltransferase complex ATPase subunit type 1 TsaE [Candidatus Neomarinimicrobiota bacterium]
MKFGWKDCESNSPAETIQIGECFSQILEPGDVLAFNGELASGKTTFIKGILKGLGYKQSVTSPTFTLINEYPAKIPVIHIDFYREEEMGRWIKIGLNDYFLEDNIIIIEWADKLKELLPKDAIVMNFSHSGLDNRKIELVTN